MKKILLFSMMVILLSACTSMKEEQEMDKMSRVNTEEAWWQQAGDPNSEYWWVSGYEDETGSDSDN